MVQEGSSDRMDIQAACKTFISRIVKDFRQKELLPLKLLFFVHASTLFVLYPYLTIHMRELGINVEETAIMSAVTPVVAIVMPPLAGIIADKIGNFKLLLSFFSCLGGVVSLLLLTVPIGRITVSFPADAVMVLGCSGNSSLEFELARDYPCNRTELFTGNVFTLTTQIKGCGFLCERDLHDTDIHTEFSSSSVEEVADELAVDAILKGRSYEVEEVDSVTGDRVYFRYNITKQHVPHSFTKRQALSDRFMDNNENWQTSIRRISENLYYLPTATMPGLSCSLNLEDVTDTSDFLLPSAARFSRMKRDSPSAYTCQFGEVPTDSSHEDVPTNIDIQSELKELASGEFLAESIQWNRNVISPSCQKRQSQATATVFLHDPEDNKNVLHEVNLNKCQPRCLATAKRTEMCQNLEKQIIYDPSLTFWVYMIIRVLIGIIGGTSFAMFEGAVIAILRDQNADYGLQRIYASIGGMISSPLSGALIDWASQGKGYTDFRPAFYLYAALKLFGGLLMLMINLEFKTGSKHVIADVMAVLKKVELIALMVASFILGTSWGYIESFLFWLLQDLGGSRSLMGITITVGGVAGIPLLAMSGPLIDKIGHANVIFIGFVFYAIRLLGYSLIYNPWHCLFFEAMESITTSLAFTAAVTYAARLSTATTDSSVQGLLGGLYFGVGKGAGSLVGGFLMTYFGTRTTFQIFAVFTAFMGSIYYFFNRFYISTLPSTETNDICKVSPSKPSNGLKRHSFGTIVKSPEVQTHDNAAFVMDPLDDQCNRQDVRQRQKTQDSETNEETEKPPANEIKT